VPRSEDQPLGRQVDAEVLGDLRQDHRLGRPLNRRIAQMISRKLLEDDWPSRSARRRHILPCGHRGHRGLSDRQWCVRLSPIGESIPAPCCGSAGRIHLQSFASQKLPRTNCVHGKRRHGRAVPVRDESAGIQHAPDVWDLAAATLHPLSNRHRAADIPGSLSNVAEGRPSALGNRRNKPARATEVHRSHSRRHHNPPRPRRGNPPEGSQLSGQVATVTATYAWSPKGSCGCRRRRRRNNRAAPAAGRPAWG
jgi:hypothetical protein